MTKTLDEIAGEFDAEVESVLLVEKFLATEIRTPEDMATDIEALIKQAVEAETKRMCLPIHNILEGYVAQGAISESMMEIIEFDLVEAIRNRSEKG